MNRFATLLLGTALVACSDSSTGPVDETPPDEPGFTATLTGAVNETRVGRAIFGIVPDPADAGSWIWGIYLDTDGSQATTNDVIVFTGLVPASTTGVPTHGDFPGADPYPLLDVSLGADPTVGQQFAIVFASSSFYSTGGQLTITESSSTQVGGTFSFSAAAFPGLTTVTVSGAFTAEPGAFLPPPSP